MSSAPATDGIDTADPDPPPDPPNTAVRLFAWGVVAVAVALVHNRLWASPNLDAFSRIARDLGSDPFADASTSDYLLTNLSLPAIARAVGMTDPHRYALLHLVVLVLACAFCVGVAQRRYGYRTARTLTVLLAASPGATVAMMWLGQPDALTFPLGVALVLVRRRGTFVALAALAGLTHPEQAVLVVACAAVVRALVVSPGDELELPRGRPAWRRIPALVVGDLGWGLVAVAVARVAIELYLRGFEIGVGRPRSDYLRMGTDLLVEHHGRAPVALVYLLWGPLWLVVIAALLLRVRGARLAAPDRYRWSWAVLGALALLALVPVAVTLDETRVYAVLTAPVLAGAAVVLTAELASWHTRALAIGTAAVLAVTLVVPGGFTAGEDAWSTQVPTGEFADFLRTGETPSTLFFWLLGPFDFVFPDVATD